MEAQERSAERWAQSADRADWLAARDLVEQKQEIEEKIRELENEQGQDAGWQAEQRQRAFVPMGGVVSSASSGASSVSNKEIGKWRAALAQVDEALKQRRAALGHRKDVEDGDGGFMQFVKGFGRGAVDALTEASLYDMGVSDLGNALALKDAAEKPEGERTEAEQAALDAAALNTYVQGNYSDAGMGYTAGGTTVEAVPFMLEFAANPLSGAGKVGAKVAVRAAEKAMAKQMKNVVTRYVVKGAGRVAGDAVGAVGMAATTGAARVGADYAQRRMGTAVPMVTEDGYMRFDSMEGGKGAGEAFGEALAAQAIENHSELLGNYFGPLLGGAGKAVGKGLEKIGLGGVNRMMERMTASQAAGAVDGFMKRTQWHGTVGEYGEEVLGGIENALIVGDQTLDTDEDTGVFNLDRNIETFLAVASMTGFISAVKTGAYGAERHRIRQELREADARGAELFGDGWAEVRSALSLNGDGTAAGGLRGILGSADYSEEQKRAALGYVAAGQKSRGAAVGEVKRRLEGELSPAAAAIEDAYGAGRGMQTQAVRMEAAAAMAEAEAALGTMDEADAAALKEGLQLNPAATLRKMIEDGATEEDVALARAYAEAMARFAGAQSAMVDAEESERRRYAEELGRRTHRSDGMIVPAMDEEGREVYVVDGTVRTHDDGTIDTEGSDVSVTVYDPETKKRRKVSPSALGTVGTAQEADALLAEEEERLRTEGERERLWQFYGRLPLRAGDRYEVMDSDGFIDTVTLAEDHGDGTYTVQTGEGDSFIIDGATLQLMSDLRRDALMEERKRRRQEARDAYEEGRSLPEMRGDPDPGVQERVQAEVDAIVQRMEEARGEIEDVFGVEAEARLYELDDGRGWDILEESGLTAEQQDAVLYYIHSKAALDGVMDASNETADARSAEVKRAVDIRTHRESGLIHPATMKVDDRRVYVVFGHVQMLPDGTAVDVRNSSKDIVVADGETGEYEFASSEAIQRVDEPVSPQEELQTALEAIEAERQSVFGNAMQGQAEVGNEAASGGERDENGLPFVTSSDGTVDFGHVSGREGMKEAPIRLSQGFNRVDDGGRNHGYGLEHIEASHGAQIRGLGFGSVEEFVEAVARNYDSVKKGSRRGGRQTYLLEHTDAHNNTLFVELSDDGSYWNVNSAGVFRKGYSENKEAVPPVPAVGNGISGDAVEVRSASETGNSMSGNSPETTSGDKDTADGGDVQASGRIPVDEKGNPVYEEAETPELAWDAIVEAAEGDAAMAQTVADGMVADMEAALKKAEKAKPSGGATVEAKIAAEKRRKAAIEAAKARLSIWRQIAGTAERRRRSAEAERRRIADEQAAIRRAEEERLEAEREEAERRERESLRGVPDMVDDTPQDARARGYRRQNGHRIDRQEPLRHLQGKEVAVKFSDGVTAKGRVAVIDASELQPSHIQGARNPLHFIDEAQPKERNDAASVLSARRIAGNIRPEEITGSVTAYTGAPTVNSRGEVIQGNSRSDALRWMWERERGQAAAYKRYLIDHASGFGLNADEIEAMQSPVLVNMLDVEDTDAIRLGQYVAQDTESGGVERIKPRNAVQKMGAEMRTFAGLLLKSADDEASFSSLVDGNGASALEWMSRRGYISPTQYASAFDSRGNLTPEAKNDLKGILYQSVFQGGSTRLEEMFNAMPVKAQRAILATAFRDYDSPEAERMLAEIQSSIMAYSALSQDGAFVSANDWKEARRAVEDWKRQYAIDDSTGESYLPAERFSNFALHLATMYRGESQRFIQGTFNKLYDLVQGTQEETLFEKPDNRRRTLAEAIKEVLNIEYDGRIRGDVLAGGSASGQGGRQGGAGGAASGGRAADRDESADGGGRALPPDLERGGQGNLRHPERRQQDSLQSEEGEEISYLLSDEVDENGHPFVVSTNGTTTFGEIFNESGLPAAPIKLSQGVQGEDGKGYGLVHIEANHGEQIRNAGFDSVEAFVSYVAENYDEGNIRVGKRRYNGSSTFLIQVTDSHDNTLFIELSKDGSYWNVNSAGIFTALSFKNEIGM